MATKVQIDQNGRGFYYTGDGKVAYPAGAWKRAMTRFVDIFIAGIPALIFTIVYSTAYSQSNFDALFSPYHGQWSFVLAQVLAILGPVLLLFVYPIFNDGQTLMKKAMKIQPMFLDDQKVWKGIMIRESIVTGFAILLNFTLVISTVDYMTAYVTYNDFINTAAGLIVDADTGYVNSTFASFLTSADYTGADTLTILTSYQDWLAAESIILDSKDAAALQAMIDIYTNAAGTNTLDGFFTITIATSDISPVSVVSLDIDANKWSGYGNFLNYIWSDMVSLGGVGTVTTSELNSSFAAFVFQQINMWWLLFLFIMIGVSKGKTGLHDIAGKTVIVDLQRMFKPTIAKTGENIDETKLQPLEENRLPTVKPSFDNDVAKNTIPESKDKPSEKPVDKKPVDKKPTNKPTNRRNKRRQPSSKEGTSIPTVKPTYKDDVTSKDKKDDKQG